MSRTLNNPSFPIVTLRAGLAVRKRLYQSLSNARLDEVCAAQLEALELPREAWHVPPPQNAPRHEKIRYLLDVCERCTAAAFKAQHGFNLEDCKDPAVYAQRRAAWLARKQEKQPEPATPAAP